MATQTTNYHLSQPEPTDNFEDFLGSYNDNMEIIDQNMGGGGGSSTFAGLTDVSLSDVQNGQVPKYNAQTQKWENANESGGGTSYSAGDGIDITSNVIKVDTAFSEAQTRANISSGDTFSTILGKIKKFFTDLKAVAFSGSYNDLTNTPTIPTATSDLTNDSGFTATSWTQIQQSGTKIASINIDGNTTDVYAPTGGTPVSSDLDIDVIDTADATKTIALPRAGRYLIVGQQGYNCTNVISITGTYTTVIDESATAHQSGETSPRNVQVIIIDAEAGVSITFTITNSNWPASGGVVCELINTDTIGTPVISYTSDGTTTVNVSNLTSDTKFILLGSGAGRSAGNRSVSTTNISKIWDIKNTGNMVAMIGDVVGGGSGSISAYGFDGGMSAVFAIPYTTSGGGGGSYTAGDGIDITSNVISVDTAFTEAGTRQNINSGDTLATILGKIKKFFTDLKTVAFSGSYNDLSDRPTIPTATSDLVNDSDFVSDASYVHTDENFTSAEKSKLSGIEAGAEVNVQSDWNEADNTADDYIKNKPSIPTNTSDLNNDSGFLTSADVSTVAISGDYDDLLNKPTIPTKVSDLNNDSGFTSVSWNQIQATGTKIAEIDIDGTTTDVYAPQGSGGGGGYETIEDADGTALTQRDTVQFGGYLKSADDNANQKTVVSDEPTEITWSAWQNLTTAQKEGTKWLIKDVPSAEGSVEADLLNLLWTNPNPTSSFTAQDVSIANLGDYETIIMACYDETSNASVFNRSYNVVDGKLAIIQIFVRSSTNNILWQRVSTISTTNNKITFNRATVYQQGSAQVFNDTIIIPYKIYGIKKKITVSFDALAESVSTLASKCMLSDGESAEKRITSINTSGLISLSTNQSKTTTCDGYLSVINAYGQSGYASITTPSNVIVGYVRPISAISGANACGTVFVRKGMKIQTGGVAFNSCTFAPLDT